MNIYAYMRLADSKFPMFEGDVRLEVPGIRENQTGDSFPCPSTFVPVFMTEQPSFNEETQNLVCASAEFVDGRWQTKWQVVERDLAAEAALLAKTRQLYEEAGLIWPEQP